MLLQRMTRSGAAALLLVVAGVGCELISEVDRTQIGTTGTSGTGGVGVSPIGAGGTAGAAGSNVLLNDASASIDTGLAGSETGGAGALGTGGTIMQPDDSGAGMVSADAGAPPDAGQNGADSGLLCAGIVPPGWSLAIYGPTSGTCPAGFLEHPVVASATVSPTACSCTCTVTQAGSCAQGALTVSTAPGSGNDACVAPSAPVTINGPGCVVAGLGSFDHASANALATIQGGACTGAAQMNPAGITKTPLRYCDVPPSSSTTVCGGTVPAGFSACIIAAGNTTCPASTPFTRLFRLQDDATVSCSACSTCSVTTTCANPTVSGFANTNCTEPAVAIIPANGTCVSTNPNEDAISSITYTATANSTCQPGSSTAAIQLVGPRTICCQ